MMTKIPLTALIHSLPVVKMFKNRAVLVKKLQTMETIWTATAVVIQINF